MPADKRVGKQGATPYARPHACPHCAAALGRASDLAKHIRTVHEKPRDYACPHCAAAFGRASDLTRHVRTVHRQGEQSGDEEEGLLLFLRLAQAT